MQENGKKQDDQEYVSEANEENSEVPKYQKGDEVGDNQEVFNDEAYNNYISRWKEYDKHGYKFKDRFGKSSLDRLKQFANDFGVALPKNIDSLSEEEINKLAGTIQSKVDDDVAIHYGKLVAPTQNGLQWLVDNNIIDKNNPVLKPVIKNGKIIIGSFEALNDAQRKEIANEVDALDETKLRSYALSNSRDNKWYYRRPDIEDIYYNIVS